jgi:hypothetical protein
MTVRLAVISHWQKASRKFNLPPTLDPIARKCQLNAAAYPFSRLILGVAGMIVVFFLIA